MTLLAITLFLLFGIKVASRFNRSLLSPLNLFCVWFLFLFGLYEPFTVFFNITPSPKLPLVLALGASGPLLGLLVFPRVALLGLPTTDFTPQPVQLRFAKVFAIIFTCHRLLVAVSNLRNGGGADVGELYSFSDTSGDEVVAATLTERIFTFFSRPIGLAYVASLGFLALADLKTRLLYIVAPVVIMTLSLFTAYTGRGNVICMTAICLILWCSIAPRRELFRIAIIGVVLVAGFFLLQPLRHGKLADGDFTKNDFIESIGTGGEWEPVACLSDIIVSQNDFDFPESIHRILTESYYWIVNWVPRSLWVGKPETDFASRASMEFYGHVYAQEKWTRNFTFIGQGYYLGNEMGVLLVGFVYGLSVALVLKISSRSAGWYGLYCYLLYEAIYLSRNCLTTWLFEACVTVGFGVLINRTIFRNRLPVHEETQTVELPMNSVKA